MTIKDCNCNLGVKCDYKLQRQGFEGTGLNECGHLAVNEGTLDCRYSAAKAVV